MDLHKLRQSLNDKVRAWGNRRTSSIKSITGYGLGDLLTTNVNFRNTAGTLGALSPLAFWYCLASGFGRDPIAGAIVAPIVTVATIPYSTGMGFIAGQICYNFGEKIDTLLGDTSRRGGHFGEINHSIKRMKTQMNKSDDQEPVRKLGNDEYTVK